MDGSNSDMVFLRLLRRAVYFSSELREAVRGRRWRRQCRNQFHTARLGQSLVAFNAAVVSLLKQARGVFVQQTGLAGTRESAPAASISICLLRCLFDVARGDAGAGTRGASDERLGGPEGAHI